jgi:hypothetical protein
VTVAVVPVETNLPPGFDARYCARIGLVPDALDGHAHLLRWRSG